MNVGAMPCACPAQHGDFFIGGLLHTNPSTLQLKRFDDF